MLPSPVPIGEVFTLAKLLKNSIQNTYHLREESAETVCNQILILVKVASLLLNFATHFNYKDYLSF